MFFHRVHTDVLRAKIAIEQIAKFQGNSHSLIATKNILQMILDSHMSKY